MFQSFYMVLFIFSLMFDSWWYESNLPIAPCPGLGAWRKFGCRWALMLWLGLPFDIPTSSMVSCLISDDLIMFPTQVPPETSTHASAAWASIFFFSGGNLIALGRLHSSTLLYTHSAIHHFMRPSMTHGHKFRSVLFVLPQVPSTDAAAVRLSFSAWRSSSGVGAWLHQSWSDVCRWLPRTQTSSPLAQAQKGK